MLRYTVLLWLCCSVWAADRWEMQYFHDVDDEQLRLDAVAFCSPSRGIASGVLFQSRREKAAAVVTSNGGKTWTLTETEESARAIFFLDETSGWMVTESGIWFTDECGRSWRRIHKRRGLTDVRFISRDRGWAIGAEMTFLETSDGGKTWGSVKAIEKLSESPRRVQFEAIDFLNSKIGLVTGRLLRARNPRMPLWLDPRPESRRERPQVNYTLETKDGGATWLANKLTIFGHVSRVKLRGDGSSSMLIEFDEYFEFPSELHHLDAGTSGKGRILRQKDLALTDILPGPVFVAAGFRPPGRMFRSPVPGKVRILRSTNISNWADDEVDYRAVATRVRLAESQGQVWAATDTGMILKLTRK